MKSLVLSLSLVFTAASTVFAGNGESMLDKLMHRKIHYPESLRQKGLEARVTVQIRVVGENQLEIVHIDSSSEELKNAVKQQILQIKCVLPKTMIGQVFNYTYKFEVEE